MTVNRDHLLAVQLLEAEATALVVSALADAIDSAAAAIEATTAAAEPIAEPPAEPFLSVDDLGRIQAGWTLAVDGTLLPWYRTVFDAGAIAVAEQVAEMRGLPLDIYGPGDPLLLNEAATRHLAEARNRFLAVGAEAWAKARSEMLQGMAAGEGIAPIGRRLRDTVGLARAAAEMVARTEVISASNAGAIARVRQMGADAPTHKQWLATLDARTRPTHAAAMGQVVLLAGKFDVGSARLDYPGDPAGIDEEVVNCRCTALFTDSPDPQPIEGIDDVTEAVAGLVAAAGMSAAQLVQTDDGIDHAVIDSNTGQPHTSGMIALLPAEPEALTVHGGEHADALHVTLWFLGPAADQPVELQKALLEQIGMVAAAHAPVDASAFGAAVWNPTGDDPCLVLSMGGQGLAELREAATGALHHAQAAAIAAGAPDWAPPDNHQPWAAHMCVAYAADPAGMLPEALTLVGPVVFDRMRVTFGAEIHDMPLTGPALVAAGGWCAPSPPPLYEPAAAIDLADPMQEDAAMPFGIRRAGAECPFEVYNTETGERVDGGCHATRQEALAHQQALQVNVDDAAGIGDSPCPPGHHPMPNGECMPDENMAAVQPQPGEHFHAIMHTQGVSTGFRTFLNLGWRVPPFAFHWQRASSAHGGMPETLQVGLVDRVVADPGNTDVLHGFGHLDLAGDVGGEYARQLVGGFARWVSIGLDEQPVKETVIWPEGEDGEEDLSEMLFGVPDQVIIDGGRIGELTSVSVPAQDDAFVEPTPELVAMLSDVTPAEPEPEAQPAAAGTEPEAPTVAELVQTLTAAAHRIEIPHVPPAWWFDEPLDVDIAGALYVTDDGRLYGALAPLGVGHRAFVHSGRRQEVPFGNVDYTRWMGGTALVQTGAGTGRIAAGPITMDCGHADRHRSNHDQAPAHYENACTVVAKACIGENRDRGVVWVAGALEPMVTVDQVSRMLACRLSGDWQPHVDRAGWQELVAALLVPSPGFPMAHQGPRVDLDKGVLVASSVPVHAVQGARRTRLVVNTSDRTVTRVGPPSRAEQIRQMIAQVDGG